MNSEYQTPHPDPPVWQRHRQNVNIKKDPQKSTALERSVRKLLEGLKMFHVTNLTLNCDVDQDTYMFGSNILSVNHLLVHTNQDIKRR